MVYVLNIEFFTHFSFKGQGRRIGHIVKILLEQFTSQTELDNVSLFIYLPSAGMTQASSIRKVFRPGFNQIVKKQTPFVMTNFLLNLSNFDSNSVTHLVILRCNADNRLSLTHFLRYSYRSYTIIWSNAYDNQKYMTEFQRVMQTWCAEDSGT